MTLDIITTHDLQRVESKIDKLLNLLEKPIDLKTRDGVKRYLHLTDSQLQYRLSNGIIKEGIHFIRKNDKLVFIPEKIKQLHDNISL